MRQPVWIALPTAFVAVPIAYYCLLQSRLSNPSVVVLGFMLNLAATYWTPCKDYTVFMLIQGSVANSILLRYIEAAMLPRHVQRKWTFLEMIEFWINSDNQVVQRFRDESKSKGKRAVSVRMGRAVTHAERGFSFYLSYAINIAWNIVVHTFARTWFMKYPYRGESWFLWPINLDSALQQVMFAVLMYSNLQLSYLLLKVPLTLIFGLPLAEWFVSPFISTSLRDFWSHRWNMRIKTTLHTIAFVPTMNYLQPNSSKSASYLRPQDVAAFSTFLVSALYHEIAVLQFCPGYPLGGSSTFFMIQGALCLLQIHIQRLTGYGITWGKGYMYSALGWFMTLSVLLFTSPMFALSFSGPITTSHLIPEQLVTFFERII